MGVQLVALSIGNLCLHDINRSVLEKNIYFIMIFAPILNSYYPMKGQIFVNYLNKMSKGLTMQIHFHSLL